MPDDNSTVTSGQHGAVPPLEGSDEFARMSRAVTITRDRLTSLLGSLRYQATHDELTALGKLRSPQWQAAVRAVPRHELVPVHHTLDPHTGQWTAQRTTLAQAYCNSALFVLPVGGLRTPKSARQIHRRREGRRGGVDAAG